MSDAEKESIQLSGEIIRLLNGRTETACLDALMRTAASVICEAHASLGDARLKAFDVGKLLELVVTGTHGKYRQAVDKDKAACN